MPEPVNGVPPADSLPGRSLWGHRDFVGLWLGEAVSVFGTQVTLLAMPLIALKLLGATTFQVGLYVAAAGRLVAFVPVALSPVRSITTAPDQAQDEAARAE